MVETIALSMSSGTTTQVEPDAIIGAFALHRAVGPIVEGWTVTHIASGKKVWTTGTLDGAIRAANYLDQAKLIPAGAAEATAWRSTLSASDRTQLIAQLQAIAPRVTE